MHGPFSSFRARVMLIFTTCGGIIPKEKRREKETFCCSWHFSGECSLSKGSRGGTLSYQDAMLMTITITNCKSYIHQHRWRRVTMVKNSLILSDTETSIITLSHELGSEWVSERARAVRANERADEREARFLMVLNHLASVSEQLVHYSTCPIA